MKQVVFVVLSALLLCACEKEHFITDSSYRKMVEADFQEKKAVFGESGAALFDVFNTEMTLAEREALMFLYAYSPLIDISFSGGEFLLDNVRLAFRAREEMPWGQDVPEDIFRHFVLPVRGGKENLDTARAVFYRELRERVAACETLEKAALEVNHWCHENVIYKPTNARTSSPLATRQRAYGRCGEESVFTLAALRTVGIPARQIYTPRWAHCDDNHAWIEVWIDGEWKYLGACEPEPRLNIAWFTLPVQRAMYVESEVFGKYTGDEEIVYTNDNFSAVNVTPHYTATTKTVVRVKDAAGRPSMNAKVEYRIFNYGEFYPVVTLYTDALGEARLTLGKGDIFVRAEKGDAVGFALLPVSRQDTLVLVLDRKIGDEFTAMYDLVPPAQHDIAALTTDEERAENDRRFVHEDSTRNAYVATFMTPARAHDIAVELGVDTARFAGYIKAARGNYGEIEKFFRQAESKELAMMLLDVIAEKDLQDTPSDVLLSHLSMREGMPEDSLFPGYVLNPRVQNELLTAFRQPIRDDLSARGITGQVIDEKTAGQLIERVKQVRVVDAPVKAVTPPAGVLAAGVTDAPSRDVFCVAVFRACGIPARLSPISGKPEYYLNGTWHTVNLLTEKVVPKGKFMLYYTGKEVKDPKYFLHFTIGKLENGRIRTIDLGSNANVDMGVGASYSTIFSRPIELEEGDYILSTGNRGGDGAVMTGITSFRVTVGEQTDLTMHIRPCPEETSVLGNVAMPLSYTPEKTGKREQLVFPGKGYSAVAIVEADKEPTNHLLRDMGSMKDDFEQLHLPLYFVFRDKDNLAKFNRSDFRSFPATIDWGYDTDGKLLERLTTGLGIQQAEHFPLVVLLNAKGEVVFLSQGYRVGLGTQIMNVMNRK